MPADRSDLEAIFRPRSIAIVGASSNPDTPGYDYLNSHKAFGFLGKLYPVNPKGGEILGLPVYRSLAEIEGDVDLVISCIPSKYVLDLVKESATKHVRAIQMFTGRFSETGRQEDIDLEKRVLEAARRTGVRIIGPNCMGILHPEHGMSFRTDMSTSSGPIGFISQSGNLLFELTHFGESRCFKFSKAVSYGNGIDLAEADFLEYMASDTDTKVIGAYIEGVTDGRRFLDALALAAKAKPVVVLKGGRTQAGGRAAASHTASLAGAHAVWDAAVAQAGAVSASTVEELIDLLIALSYLKPGSGRNLAMVGAGGGRSVLTADLCEELGLSVPSLPDDVEQKLAAKTPELAGWVTNPVDQSILAGSGLGGAQVLEWLDESPGIDMLVANVGEPWAFGRPNSEAIIARVTDRFIQVGTGTSKPFAVIIAPSDYQNEERWRIVSAARDKLVAAGLAVFPSVERAVRTLARLAQYWNLRS
jgi:acyl-CoA synthetase (NDP forming)